MKKPGPKNPETAAVVERLNIYLRENPTTMLETAAKILDIKATRIRKWKQFGWLEEHLGHREVARQKRQARLEVSQSAGIEAQLEAPGDDSKPCKVSKPLEAKENNSPGVVAGRAPKLPESMDELIERGKNMKTSEIRAMIKAYMIVSLNDPKAVSNYATALKSLAGVQDVELDDLYETEQLMQIYYPAEKSLPADIPESDEQ